LERQNLVNKKRPQVLVVEDNPINVIVLKKFIEHLCDADSVTNGAKALQMLADKPYDMVLLDINLGNADMTGMDVLRKIQEDQQFSQIPVVAVTAHLIASDIERYKQAGFADFISKPINREDILEVFAKYVK
jgi:CheY-like chemotaxis protein